MQWSLGSFMQCYTKRIFNLHCKKCGLRWIWKSRSIFLSVKIGLILLIFFFLRQLGNDAVVFSRQHLNQISDFQKHPYKSKILLSNVKRETRKNCCVGHLKFFSLFVMPNREWRCTTETVMLVHVTMWGASYVEHNWLVSCIPFCL